MRPLRTERAQFLHDNLDLPEAAQFEGARWEHFQIVHLEDDSTFRIESKSRQIAWSWLAAAEAVAAGILDGHSSLFQSVNLDEAQEKIRYAKRVIEALPKSMRPKIVTDNKQELEFSNGARLISLPGTPSRGKAQFHVYLDEFAHAMRDVEIYTAILPVVSKGERRLRIGSSPMGATGRFWEIYGQQLRPYPGYTRKLTPWWEIHAFCRNVREAVKLAPTMETAARVDMFGNDRLQAIYANMPEDDFQQEYEGSFVDETTSYFPWAEIKALQAAHAGPCLMVKGVDNGKAAVGELAALIADGAVEAVLAGGMDIGRTRDTTELYFVGLTALNSYPLRLAITLDGTQFDDQMDVLETAVTTLPIMKLLIDQTGIGMQMAETMSGRYPSRVEGVTFTNPAKALWAGNAKQLTQQRRAPIPNDRALAYQMHSIKRRVTAAKNIVFDVETSEKHHADKFWAWALAGTAAMGGNAVTAVFAQGSAKKKMKR
jgi:phage FluMu gp28-like protein